MPEAVIVSAARSPIGRANKGSLKDFRPDDLTALIVQAALDKIPDLDPTTIEDLLPRLRPARRRVRQQHGPRRQRCSASTVPGATITRYCSSSVQTTRMAFHAIKAGEGDIFVSAGVETCLALRQGHLRPHPRHPQPALRRRRGPHRRVRRGRPGLARPARGRPAARHLHRDGPDGRERRPAARPRPQGARRVRRPLAEPRREGHRRRLLGARDHPGHPPRRHGRVHRRRPARRRDLRRHRAARPGLPPRRRRHRGQLLRAQRRRRRGRHHERHQGRRARPHPAGADRVDRRVRPLPRDHGPRPGRGDQAGAHARRA